MTSFDWMHTFSDVVDSHGVDVVLSVLYDDRKVRIGNSGGEG